MQINFSTKNKTMILVIALFMITCVVFSILRQIDIENLITLSKKDFEEQIGNIYTTTLNRTREFYTSRAYVNIQSENIKYYLKKENKEKIKQLTMSRFLVLKDENPYLINMKFYNHKGDLITLLGKDSYSLKPMENKREYFSFEDKKLSYHIITPFYEKNNLLGYVEFSLYADYFLKEIKAYSKLNGEIIFDEKLQDSELIRKNGQTFIIHIFKLSKIKDNEAKIIFYQNISEQEKNIEKTFKQALILSIVLILIIFIILHFGFKVLIKKLELSEALLRNLNANLEQKINDELCKRREQERILMHQSRLASMGEMIGNIAHQWRQPLTELNAIITHISLLVELKKLDKKSFLEQEKNAEFLIAYMSKTIDDFRNFFKPNRKKEKFCIEKTIENALMLLKSSLKNHNIKIETNLKNNSEIYGFESQFSQAILNIICNAKDILIERKIENPCIKISSKKKFNVIKICIEDNGGGISIKPIEKIFKPYVSSKHAILGTGIGLYMSKIIIEKNFKERLKARNKKQGAKFIIILVNF